MTKDQCQAVANAVVDYMLSKTPRDPDVQAIVDKAKADYVRALIYGSSLPLEAYKTGENAEE